MQEVERQQGLGWNDEDNGNGVDVPEKHLKRETEDGTYEIRETGKGDEFNELTAVDSNCIQDLSMHVAAYSRACMRSVVSSVIDRPESPLVASYTDTIYNI